jgi:hypothetical protein
MWDATVSGFLISLFTHPVDKREENLTCAL